MIRDIQILYSDYVRSVLEERNQEMVVLVPVHDIAKVVLESHLLVGQRSINFVIDPLLRARLWQSSAQISTSWIGCDTHINVQIFLHRHDTSVDNVAPVGWKWTI